MVQSMEVWLCKWEKPSTSQPRHCEASALGFVSPKGLLHMEDRKLLLTPAEGAATRAPRWQQLTLFGDKDPMSAWDVWIPCTVVMLPPGLVTSLGKEWLSAKWCEGREGPWLCCARPLLSGCSSWLCPVSSLGTDLSTGCLPNFLGKEGAHGTFHEVPWHRQASDTG